MSGTTDMDAGQLNSNSGSTTPEPPQQQQPTDAATILQRQTLNLDARLQRVEAALAQAQHDLATSNEATHAAQQAASSSAAQAAAAQQQLAALNTTQTTTPAATPATHAVPAVERLKIPEPERYRGSQDRMSVREWVDSIKERFMIGNVALDTKYAVMYAGAYLINEAKIWFKMYQNDTTTTRHNFKDFEIAIIERFRDRREEEKARIRMDSVRQISTVDAYNIAFDKAVMYLENITGTRRDEADLVHIYKNGLNSNIKVVLAVKDTHKLDEMKRTALEVEAAMRSTGARLFSTNVNSNKNISSSTGYNKQYGNKPLAGKPSSYSYRGGNGSHSTPFNRYPPSNTSNYNQWRSGNSSSNTGHAPMDIDKPGTRSISQNNHRGGYKSGNVSNQPPAGK